MNNLQPQKGDVIINPNTSRPIRVGSKTWLTLVKTGVIAGNYTDPRELASIDHDSNEVDVQDQIRQVNKTLPRNQQAVRGRGIYKGKIVSRTKTPSAHEIAKYNAKFCSSNDEETVFEKRLGKCNNDEETILEKILEKMMIEEMETVQTPYKKVKENRQICKCPDRNIY